MAVGREKVQELELAWSVFQVGGRKTDLTYKQKTVLGGLKTSEWKELLSTLRRKPREKHRCTWRVEKNFLRTWTKSHHKQWKESHRLKEGHCCVYIKKQPFLLGQLAKGTDSLRRSHRWPAWQSNLPSKKEKSDYRGYHHDVIKLAGSLKLLIQEVARLGGHGHFCTVMGSRSWYSHFRKCRAVSIQSEDAHPCYLAVSFLYENLPRCSRRKVLF